MSSFVSYIHCKYYLSLPGLPFQSFISMYFSSCFQGGCRNIWSTIVRGRILSYFNKIKSIYCQWEFEKVFWKRLQVEKEANSGNVRFNEQKDAGKIRVCVPLIYSRAVFLGKCLYSWGEGILILISS